MKKLRHTLMGFSALILFAPSAFAGANAGESAPDFEGVNVLSGETFKLSNHKDDIVVLEWTNHQCPYVVKHYDSGNMQKLQKNATEQGVKWVSIVSSANGKQGHTTAKEAADIVAKKGAYPSVKILDESGKIGHKYGARTTPHMFVIKDGIIQYAGAIDDNSSPKASVIPKSKNYVTAAIADIKAGNAVQIPSTQSYGCGVKYAK